MWKRWGPLAVSMPGALAVSPPGRAAVERVATCQSPGPARAKRDVFHGAGPSPPIHSEGPSNRGRSDRSAFVQSLREAAIELRIPWATRTRGVRKGLFWGRTGGARYVWGSRRRG
ncbi:unnamed protein product [Arctogadus glacialis]